MSPIPRSAILARPAAVLGLLPGLLLLTATPGRSQCPEAAPLQDYTGGGSVVCPCFVPGEEAGVILSAPAADYPLQVLRVGIGWGSQFGGNPNSFEQAIHVYNQGLPDPGPRIFTLSGPVLTDGVINEFNLEPLPNKILIPSGPIGVTLEFLNQSSGNPFASSVVHDGNGCQPSSVVKASPGGWIDACSAGLSGDWVFYVVYRPCFPVGVDEEPRVLSNRAALLLPPAPHPVRGASVLEIFLEDGGEARLDVYDVSGRLRQRIHEGALGDGWTRIRWEPGDLVPGLYWIELRAAGARSVQKALLLD